jgi:hypothetical protein
LVGSSSSSRSAGHISARELQPHAPAAGEARHRGVELVAAKAEPEQHRLRARPRVEAAGEPDRLVRVRHRLAVVGRLGVRELGLCFGERRVAGEHEVCRALVAFRHLLRDFGDAPARRHRELAGVGAQPRGDQREQRRLAGAIAADEADLLARLDGEAGAVEDELGATAKGELAENEHRPIFAARGSCIDGAVAVPVHGGVDNGSRPRGSSRCPD